MRGWVKHKELKDFLFNIYSENGHHSHMCLCSVYIVYSTGLIYFNQLVKMYVSYQTRVYLNILDWQICEPTTYVNLHKGCPTGSDACARMGEIYNVYVILCCHDYSSTVTCTCLLS